MKVDPLNHMVSQSFGAGVVELLVNVILCVEFPRAIRPPSISRLVPLVNLAMTPGSIFKKTPESTMTFPATMYGLLANVHVVFSEISPLTKVD
jgi:hypothetical protein